MYFLYSVENSLRDRNITRQSLGVQLLLVCVCPLEKISEVRYVLLDILFYILFSLHSTINCVMHCSRI